MNDYVISFTNEHERKLTSKNIQSRIKPILDKLFNKGLDSKDTRNKFAYKVKIRNTHRYNPYYIRV